MASISTHEGVLEPPAPPTHSSSWGAPLEEAPPTSQSTDSSQPVAKATIKVAGPVSLVTSSPGVWTGATQKLRVPVVWWDTLIRHQREERREIIKRKEEKKPL